MDLWRSIAGMVEVELTSADLYGTLNDFQQDGSTVFRLHQTGALSVSFCISRTKLKRLRVNAHKKGDKVEVLHHYGLFWKYKALLRRPVLLFGIMILAVLTLFIPTRVLFIEIEGNKGLPSRMILEQAQFCGIYFGASRNEVRSERVKNALLQHLPQLQWTGVNTYGCRAVISVQERQTTPDEDPSGSVSSIVASRDGVITEMTVVQGTPVCKVGQSVQKGQLLISAYSDLGLQIHAERAMGEVFAQTQRSLKTIFPAERKVKTERSGCDRSISMILGKKRINFSKGSGISHTTCDKMYSEYYMTLPGGFRLPIAIAVEDRTCYDLESTTKEDTDQIEQSLRGFSYSYVCSQMIAGRIDAGTQMLSCIDGVYCMIGKFACYEMIGITHLEEDLVDHEADRTYRQRRTSRGPDRSIRLIR